MSSSLSSAISEFPSNGVLALRFDLPNRLRGLALLGISFTSITRKAETSGDGAYFVNRFSLKALSFAEAGDMRSSDGET